MKNIILNLINGCNLNCNYCYYKNEINHNSGQVSINLVENLFIKISQSRHKDFFLALHGGEPLLRNIKFLKKIFDLENKYLRKKDVTIGLQTNGTLISDEFIDVMREINKKKNLLSLGLSIDGPEIVHDTHRRFNNGNGSFKTILKNLEKLERNGIEYSILSVVTDITLKYINYLYPFYKSLSGLISVDVLPVNVSKSNLFLKKKNLYKVWRTLFDEWIDDVNSSFDFRTFRTVLFILMGIKGLRICSLGKVCFSRAYLISLDHKGNVAPCDHFPEIILGNIFNSNIDDLYFLDEKRRKLIKEQNNNRKGCLFCQWYELCGGGCPSHYSEYKKENYYCDDLKSFFSDLQKYLDNKIVMKKGKLERRSINKIKNKKLRTEIVDKISSSLN